jgi:hypothetical protein
MKNISLAAGLLAASCTAPLAAPSCPSGQILRVSSGVCQPKTAEAVQWLKQGASKPMAKPSAGAAVGSLLRSTSPDARPLTPFASQAAKAPVRRPLIAHPSETQPGVASAAADTSLAKVTAAPQTTAPRSARGADLALKPSREFRAERADPQAAAPAPGVQEAGGPPEPVRLPPGRRTATVPNAPARATPAQELGQPAPSGVASPRQPERTAANVARASPQPPAASARPPSPQQPPPTESPVAGGMATATITAPETTGTIPQSRAAEPSGADPGLVDWGDEGQLVAALRANWQATPVEQTFRVGERVPADVPLLALPQPYAGRDRGLNMRYLMANSDAVLVLPTLRIVIDVFAGSTESTR